MVTQEPEKTLTEINTRIAQIDAKQDKLIMYLLGLIRSHIIETSNSMIKSARDRLSFIVALSGLGISAFALGVVVVDLVTRYILMACGVFLLVYALIQTIKLEKRMGDIERHEKNTEEILNGIEDELKEHMTSENEK